MVGFGASGRNGGWASALFPQTMDRMQRQYGRDAARAMQQAMFDNIDDMTAVLDREGINCDWHVGGTVLSIRSKAQQVKAQEEVDYWRAWGFGEDYYRMLGAEESAEQFNVSHNFGAVYTPHCARIQPAKLVRGLAHAVERLGVEIFENSAAVEIGEKWVRTESGTASAPVVVEAIEAWTTTLEPRRSIPVYSLMVATVPLSDQQWSEIGLHGFETFADYRNLIIYGQRTADGRIAFGGRGAPYHWGSALQPKFDSNTGIHRAIEDVLHELLPQLGDVEFTHHWGGPLGIHRDWHPSVMFDAASGRAYAGGYVGDGVATSHLAGRTLAHLITGTASELTSLPWVNHASPLWEREPIRWIGANAGLRAMTIADTEERLTNRPSMAARIFNRFLGH